MRFRRHNLAKDSAERAQLKAKIEQLKAANEEGACMDCPDDVEKMHRDFCATQSGSATKICKHWATTNHACNTTGGLMTVDDDDDLVYVKRIETGCA